MTEAEWLASASPDKMLGLLRTTGAVSDRKLRLLACGCCRLAWPLLRKASRAAVEIAEQFADGLLDEAARASGARVAREASWNASESRQAAADMVERAFSGTAEEAVEEALGVASLERGEVAFLVRELFGNPFHRVTLAPEWLAWEDGCVVKLARGIFEEGAFDRLPILADALEEASCDDRALLGHLRGPGPHARGCWALDLVLGKE